MWEKTMVAAEAKSLAADLKKAATPPVHRKEEKNTVLQVQTAVCVLLLLVCAALRASGSGLWEKIRQTCREGLYQSEDFSEERELIRFAGSAAENLPINLEELGGTAGAQNAGGPTILAGEDEEAPAGYDTRVLDPGQTTQNCLTAYTLTSGYGWRSDPFSGERAFHSGVDLAAGAGTPILPAMSGVVYRTAQSKEYGNYLQISHPGGVMTLYAHMEYIFVHAGQQVDLNTVLGTVGSTGNATGPHLHLEVLWNGVRYDPSLVAGL